MAWHLGGLWWWLWVPCYDLSNPKTLQYGGTQSAKILLAARAGGLGIIKESKTTTSPTKSQDLWDGWMGVQTLESGWIGVLALDLAPKGGRVVAKVMGEEGEPVGGNSITISSSSCSRRKCVGPAHPWLRDTRRMQVLQIRWAVGMWLLVGRSKIKLDSLL